MSTFLSSLFQKKCLVKSQDYHEEEFVSIEHDSESENSKSTIYMMPRPAIDSAKIFVPQQWSIQRFQIGRHLGCGKFGHVYLARERESKHIVALKVLSKKQLVNDDIINQIRRQIEIHTHLIHPNILRMYGFFFDEKRIYYILEYASHGELYEIFRKVKKFPEEKVAVYIKQVILALMYLHGLKIIHRDIKPENILLCANDQIKVSDFGWSVHSNSVRKTYCGTPDYICPEIARREDYDYRIDHWTLGVLAYELASGKAPFNANVRSQIIKNVKRGEYQFPDYFSPELCSFVDGLLRKRYKERMSLEESLLHPWILKHCS